MRLCSFASHPGWRGKIHYSCTLSDDSADTPQRNSYLQKRRVLKMPSAVWAEACGMDGTDYPKHVADWLIAKGLLPCSRKATRRTA